MNKVSFFKNKQQNTPSDRDREALFYIDRIRSGKNKKTIEELRLCIDEEKKKQIKGSLPAVTFGATFEVRNKKQIKKSSGLIILDFDKVPNVIDLKTELAKDSYIYSCWVSPSGNGVKALVKILSVESDEEYTAFYKSIISYFNNDFLDKSGSDISRLCFESYDEDLYLNENSKIYTDFTPLEIPITTIGVVTNIPLQDQDEIANRIMIWFKKHYDGGNRNTSFHKLALAFNDFGVNMSIAERYILQNEQKDFNKTEILSLIKSAYKHTANFGTKFFEDYKTKNLIKSMTTIGKKDEHILLQFPKLNKDNLLTEIKNQRESININEFWERDEEGKLKIIAHKYKFYLENKNFFKHYPLAKSKTFTFITKEGSFVDEVSEYQIKDFVLKSLISNDDLKPFDLVASSQKAFNPNYLSMIDTADFAIEEDTAEYAMIYYRNNALRIFKDRIEEINYSDLKGFVWKKQVIDRDFISSDHHKSEYRTFLWFAASQDQQKYNSLKSVIGYLMHSFKTSANNKAIIFNDETISENPNGGSGKGVFWNALSHLKKVSSIDGKTFEFTKSFPYQTVPADTQLLVFDDVKKNFQFESLFSLITEGITLEYKGQDAIKLPIQKSPKILITTNYTIGGVGGSFERRKFEVEMSSHFGSHYSPLDMFGHMLFDDWNETEWKYFDSFMIYCLQYYLKNGLVSFRFKNLENRKLINETSQDFLEWMKDDVIPLNERLTKTFYYDKFLEDYKDYKRWLSQKKFTQWVQKYCDFYGKTYSDGSSNGQRWFQISTTNTKTDSNECPY